MPNGEYCLEDVVEVTRAAGFTVHFADLHLRRVPLRHLSKCWGRCLQSETASLYRWIKLSVAEALPPFPAASVRCHANFNGLRLPALKYSQTQSHAGAEAPISSQMNNLSQRTHFVLLVTSIPYILSLPMMALPPPPPPPKLNLLLSHSFALRKPCSSSTPNCGSSRVRVPKVPSLFSFTLWPWRVSVLPLSQVSRSRLFLLGTLVQ